MASAAVVRSAPAQPAAAAAAAMDLGIWGVLALWRHYWVAFLAVYAIQGSSHALESGNALLKNYWLEIWMSLFLSQIAIAATATYSGVDSITHGFELGWCTFIVLFGGGRLLWRNVAGPAVRVLRHSTRAPWARARAANTKAKRR